MKLITHYMHPLPALYRISNIDTYLTQLCNAIKLINRCHVASIGSHNIRDYFRAERQCGKHQIYTNQFNARM